MTEGSPSGEGCQTHDRGGGQEHQCEGIAVNIPEHLMAEGEPGGESGDTHTHMHARSLTRAVTRTCMHTQFHI